MIQIIGYRPYINKDGKKKTTDKFYTLDTYPSTVTELFHNLSTFLSKIDSKEHFDLHYTLAECYSSKRLFRAQKAWAIDIDDADIKRLDEYWSLVATHTNIDMGVFTVVKSGGGLHFVWEQVNYFATDSRHLTEVRSQYVELCKRIQKDMSDVALPGKVDSQIIKDTGTLRLPSTMNHNYDPPRPCVIHHLGPMTIDWNIDSIIPPKPIQQSLNEEEIRKYPSPHADFIKESCGFMKHAYENAAQLTEPEWLAALTIASRFENAVTECHQMSKPHVGYTHDDTEAKIHHARNDLGPFTCDKISELTDKCSVCSYRGKVKSPIQLRGPDYIATKESGFWFWAIDKGVTKPTRPDYNGLRLYFQSLHEYMVLESQEIFVWGQTHWEPFSESKVKAFAQDNFDPKPSSAHVQEFYNLLLRTNLKDSKFVAHSTERLLNLKNGVLDLRTMKLLPHSPDYFFTNTLNYDYDVTAKCPVFDRFMNDVTCDDVGLKNILLEFMGYAFSGMSYKWHKALIMIGDGSNGKSTFLNILKKLAKGSYSVVMLNQLEDEKARCALVGKLFNVAEETPRKALMDGTMFKMLTAGGEYNCRQVYKETLIVDENRTKFIFACNELPTLTDFTHGMIRRLIIVPFDQTFTDDRADTDMDSKLEKELSGILNRVIEAYHRLIKQNGFTKSDVVDAAINEFKETSNTVEMWAGEMIEHTDNENHHVKMNDAFTSYNQFCVKLNIYPCSIQKFGRDFSRMVKKKAGTVRNGKSTYRAIKGIKLQDQGSF